MKLLKHEYDKHLIITLIVLIALPVLLGTTNFFSSGIYNERIIRFSLIYFNDPYTGLWIVYSFQYIVFAVMLILYPIYPLIFSIEKYFWKRNPRVAIAEYDLLKKITYALFPFFILALALMIASRITPENQLSSIINSLGDSMFEPLVYSILGVIFFVVGSALLRIILLNTSRHFGFYIARMAFRAITEERDDVERMKFVIKGLNSYNMYIRRNLGLQINNLKMIYSRMVSDPTIDRTTSLNDLSKAFEDGDRLKAIRCIFGLLKSKDPENFLVKESTGKKLQEWGGILGTLASTAGAILGAAATLRIPGLS
jgi:hypothetical protein